MRAPIVLLQVVSAVILGSCNGRGGSLEDDAPPVDSLTPLQELEQRILNDPDDHALYAQRAHLYEAGGNRSEAIDDLKRALLLDSTNVSYRVALGDLYYATLKLEEARTQFQMALQIDPLNNEARLKEAEMQMMLRQYRAAMDLVNEALRSDPNQAQAYFIKGWIHMETGDTNLAISSFRTCVEQDPSNYKAFMQLGLLHAQRQDPLAMEYYGTAIELRPNEVEGWYNQGMFAQENGMDSLALRCYERIRLIDPRNATAWYNSGFVRLEHLGDLPQAVRDFTAATKLLPGYFQAWYNRGLAYERKGALDSAAMDYQHALRIQPEYDPAARGLARLQAKGLRIAQP